MELTQSKTFQDYLAEATGQESIKVLQARNFETCHSCGKKVVQTYQKNFCKPCLVKIFQRLQPLINSMGSICNKSNIARLGL